MLRMLLVLTGIAGVLVLTGCKTEEDYRNERAEKAIRYFEYSQLRKMVPDKKLTLAECIAIGLKHNLDLKVKQQEEDIAAEMRTAELLGMLPELNINDGFSGRTNIPASSSKAYDSSGATYGASQNQDKVLNTFNIDLALSVMDFGLAFFNSQQAHDRVLLRKQRTERMAQNLTLDIINAYCRVAAAQTAWEITSGMLVICRDRDETIKKLRKSNKITPFRAFEEIRRFNEMERRQAAYEQEYYNACVELRALLGFYPSAEITVDDSFLKKMPSDEVLPSLDVMEQIALIRRPELQETEIQRHISLIECRKAILTMFPNARVFLDFNNVNNSFLYNQNWWEMGVVAAFNLLKLPQKIAQTMAYYRQADAETMRTFAQSIAVISQVRISHANIMANKEIYSRAEKSYQNYDKTLKAARKNQKVAVSDLSQLEIDHMVLTTAESRIERTLALADYYISFYRLMNSMGLREYKLDKFSSLPADLEAARKEAGVILKESPKAVPKEKAKEAPKAVPKETAKK